MGDKSPYRSNPLLFLFCLLLVADLVLRLADVGPVEATRISSRETDVAFTGLAGSNQALAQSNQALARSIQSLTSQLGSLNLAQWAEAEEKLSASQEKLSEASESLSGSISLLSESLKATEQVSQKGEGNTSEGG
jgi:cell division protein FtsB